MDEAYYEALLKCAERYALMAATVEVNCYDPELSRFIQELANGARDKLPLMKLNRWLGYIQGVLIERGITTVEAERDWTRPLFRPLDF